MLRVSRVQDSFTKGMDPLLIPPTLEVPNCGLSFATNCELPLNKTPAVGETRPGICPSLNEPERDFSKLTTHIGKKNLLITQPRAGAPLMRILYLPPLGALLDFNDVYGLVYVVSENLTLFFAYGVEVAGTAILIPIWSPFPFL